MFILLVRYLVALPFCHLSASFPLQTYIEQQQPAKLKEHLLSLLKGGHATLELLDKLSRDSAASPEAGVMVRPTEPYVVLLFFLADPRAAKEAELLRVTGCISTKPDFVAICLNREVLMCVCVGPVITSIGVVIRSRK